MRQASGAGGRRIWISLDDPVLPREMPPERGWKSLDFLGSSRPNRTFSMGYNGFPEKFFLLPSSSSRRRRALRAGRAWPRAWVGEDILRSCRNLSTPFAFSEANVEGMSVAGDMSGLGSARSVR